MGIRLRLVECVNEYNSMLIATGKVMIVAIAYGHNVLGNCEHVHIHNVISSVNIKTCVTSSTDDLNLCRCSYNVSRSVILIIMH